MSSPANRLGNVEVTFVPQGVGVHLPANSDLTESYYANVAHMLRAPFFVNGETNPMLLMRMPHYIPTVDISTESCRNLAASIAHLHKHRMWLLRYELSTEPNGSAKRAARYLEDWQAKTPFRTLATPGVELSPYNLNWTDRLVKAWGQQPNFFLFDIDMSGYDAPSDWRQDVVMLDSWLASNQGNAMAILNVTLPKKTPPTRIYERIEQMWRMVESSLRIVSIFCKPHVADNFMDHNLRLTKTGESYVNRRRRDADIRGDGQTASAQGSRA